MAKSARHVRFALAACIDVTCLHASLKWWMKSEFSPFLRIAIFVTIVTVNVEKNDYNESHCSGTTTSNTNTNEKKLIIINNN